MSAPDPCAGTSCRRARSTGERAYMHWSLDGVPHLSRSATWGELVAAAKVANFTLSGVCPYCKRPFRYDPKDTP